MKTDSGLAPNPYWGYCTLGLCTPNHQGIKLEADDWIMGTEPLAVGGRLIYAMKVAEKTHFDKYFKDSRYEQKKPRLAGNWKEKCGDNIYFLGPDGNWKQLPVLYHNTPEQIIQDTRHPYVYVSRKYYYFGENAIDLPVALRGLIRDRHGCKCDHQSESMMRFAEWIESNLKPGIYGLPRDRNLFRIDIQESTCFTCSNVESLKKTRTNVSCKPRKTC